tara:strand:- start:165 stop:590 length:426 start_codon:yes stop_codon:yes gene_type:complete
MSIALAIKQLYPNATDDQFRVEDHKDGRGAFVAYWGVTDPDGASLPEPSIESLRVVEAELLATPPPPLAQIWTVREFMAKFTNAELIAIAEAKRTNAQLEVWWTQATAGSVERDHPDTSAGLAYLKSLGLITDARIAEIVA